MFRIVSNKKLRDLQDKAMAPAKSDNFVLFEAQEQKREAERRAELAESRLAELQKSIAPKKTLYCSFCGKSQHHVKKLIAGPSTFICNECVELCNDIVNETTKAETDLKLVDEAIEAYWGSRCPDADPECKTCRAWDYIDKVSGRAAENQERAQS